MPLMAKPPESGRITAMLPAFDGLQALVTAPAGTDTSGIPGGGPVVGWAVVDDPKAAGGARLDPVFAVAGRTWTPDQYRAAYGRLLGVQVGRG